MWENSANKAGVPKEGRTGREAPGRASYRTEMSLTHHVTLRFRNCHYQYHTQTIQFRDQYRNTNFGLAE